MTGSKRTAPATEPQAVIVPPPTTRAEILQTIHQLGTVLKVSRHAKFIPPGMSEGQYCESLRSTILTIRELIQCSLVDLGRTGFAVPDKWYGWLPQPAKAVVIYQSNPSPCYVWPLANWGDAYRMAAEVEQAISGGGDGTVAKNGGTARTIALTPAPWLSDNDKHFNRVSQVAKILRDSHQALSTKKCPMSALPESIDQSPPPHADAVREKEEDVESKTNIDLQ